ncbi:MAG: ankyrin repeat domain-containing protein [Polyangiaceae bacterium]
MVDHLEEEVARAEALAAKGDWETAFRLLDEVVLAHRASAAVRARYAQLAVDVGTKQSVVTPFLLKAQELLLEACQLASRTEPITRLLRTVGALYVPTVRATPVLDQWVREGNQHFSAGQYAEAAALYEKVVEQDKSHFAALKFRGNCAFVTKRLDEAEEWFGRALEANPRDPQVHLFLASTASARGDSALDLPLKHLCQAVATHPHYWGAWLNIEQIFEPMVEPCVHFRFGSKVPLALAPALMKAAEFWNAALETSTEATPAKKRAHAYRALGEHLASLAAEPGAPLPEGLRRWAKHSTLHSDAASLVLDYTPLDRAELDVLAAMSPSPILGFVLSSRLSPVGVHGPRLEDRPAAPPQVSSKAPDALAVTLRYPQTTVDELVKAHAVTAGRDGIFIRTPKPFPPGTRLKLELRLKGDDALVLSGAGVVTVALETAMEDVGPGMAVKLATISTGAERLAQMVAQQEPGSSLYERASLHPSVHDPFYLTAGDLRGMQCVQDSRNGEQLKPDTLAQQHGVKRAGLAVWQGATSAAVWRVVDSRWIFSSEAAATAFYQATIPVQSEGLQPCGAGVDLNGGPYKLFRGNTPLPERLGVAGQMTHYVLITRVDRVVAKLYVAQGLEAPAGPDPLEITILGEAVARAISSALVKEPPRFRSAVNQFKSGQMDSVGLGATLLTAPQPCVLFAWNASSTDAVLLDETMFVFSDIRTLRTFELTASGALPEKPSAFRPSSLKAMFEKGNRPIPKTVRFDAGTAHAFDLSRADAAHALNAKPLEHTKAAAGPVRPLSADDLRGLTQIQHEAIFDLLAAVTLAEGIATPAELAFMEQLVVHGPWAKAGFGAREIVHCIEQALTRFRGADAGGRRAITLRAARDLATTSISEQVLLTLVFLSQSDGADAAESDVLRAVALEVGIADERLDQIKRAVPLPDIHAATGRGDVASLTSALDRGVSVNARDGNEWTLLHVAAACGQGPAAEVLLTRGADPNLLHNQGSSPLMCASNKPFADMVRLLLRHGANPNLESPHKWMPIHIAAMTGQKGVINALLENGANPNIPDGYGCTALHHAAHEGFPDIVGELLERGASVDARAENGLTPLHSAAARDRAECVHILLRAGADPNAPAADGGTPVCAAASNQPTALKLLLEAGGDPNRAYSLANRPLHIAARSGATTCVALLCDAGALLDAQNEGGGTPLLLASIHRRADVCDLLLARRANPDIPTKEGWTARTHRSAAKTGALKTINWTDRSVPQAPQDIASVLVRFREKKATDAQVKRAIAEHGAWHLLFMRAARNPYEGFITAPDGQKLLPMFSNPALLQSFLKASTWIRGEVQHQVVDGATALMSLDPIMDLLVIDPNPDQPERGIQYSRGAFARLAAVGAGVRAASALSAPTLGPDQLAILGKTRTFGSLSWFGLHANHGPVALRTQNGRVLIPVFTATDSLNAFADVTEAERSIDWGESGAPTVVIKTGGLGAFDVLDLDCDGVLVDPAGPRTPVVLSLQSCDRIVQAGPPTRR